MVINKVDRPTARVEEVESEIFDLFCNLDASEDQLDYPTIYAAAKHGWAIKSLDKERQGVSDLLNVIQDHIPHPDVKIDDDLRMLITQTEYNQFFGRQLIGRIASGRMAQHDKICSINQDGSYHETGKVQRIIKKYGMAEIELKQAAAGDIVQICGF